MPDFESPEEREYYEELVKLDEITNAEDFLDKYGFEHDCRCAKDWLEGNCGMVTECYCKMTDDALEACFRMKGELAGSKREADQLRLQVAELGEQPRV